MLNDAARILSPEKVITPVPIVTAPNVTSMSPMMFAAEITPEKSRSVTAAEGATPLSQLPPVDILPSPARPVHTKPEVSVSTARTSVLSCTVQSYGRSDVSGTRFAASVAVMPVFSNIGYSPLPNAPPFFLSATVPFAGSANVVTEIGVTPTVGVSMFNVESASNVRLETVDCAVAFAVNVAPSLTVTARATVNPALMSVSPASQTRPDEDDCERRIVSLPLPAFVIAPEPWGSA